MKGFNERMKELRKALGLTMEEFGSKIGMTKASVSRLEAGINGASEQTIRLICSTWGVDYFWLTNGTGEMFVDSMDYLIDELAAEKHWKPETVKVMKKLYSLPPEQFDLVCKVIDSMGDK